MPNPAAVSLLLLVLPALARALQPPNIGGCDIFPADSWWNTPIDDLPVHQHSALWVNNIGATTKLKADFGSGEWEGSKIGIPFLVVPENEPLRAIQYDAYGDQSDPGPFPIPLNAPREGNPADTGDRHVLVLQQGKCMLYELYYARPQTRTSSWLARSGAKFDLKSHAFRPLGWTSADAAGLPILPGLVRYDEVLEGEIKHAIRFTVQYTRKKWNWPATHIASSRTGVEYPPMGARFRLKNNFPIDGFPPQIRVILRALKKYGMVLADHGGRWFMSGVPDERWDNGMLNREFAKVLGENMEAVDVSSLMISERSGQVRTPASSPTTTVTSPPPTHAPTKVVTSSPTTKLPTTKPSKAPTRTPTRRPTKAPTKKPTRRPTKAPTRKPTKRPTKRPTRRPTRRDKKRGLEEVGEELA